MHPAFRVQSECDWCDMLQSAEASTAFVEENINRTNRHSQTRTFRFWNKILPFRIIIFANYLESQSTKLCFHPSCCTRIPACRQQFVAACSRWKFKGAWGPVLKAHHMKVVAAEENNGCIRIDGGRGLLSALHVAGDTSRVRKLESALRASQ